MIERNLRRIEMSKMKKSIFIILVLLTLSGLAFAQTEKQVSGDLSKAEREVLGVINEWREAMMIRDMDVLEKIFAEDVIITTFGGKTRGKKAELEAVKPNSKYQRVSITNEDVRIKAYGETAVVTALAKMYVPVIKTLGIAFRYTSVFVKKDGRWQIVALHISRIEDSKK